MQRVLIDLKYPDLTEIELHAQTGRVTEVRHELILELGHDEPLHRDDKRLIGGLTGL